MTKQTENAARRWLETADVTPTGYRVGRFMVDRARVATAADVRRKVKPGEIFCYWSEAKMAIALGKSVRQIKRGVRSLREAGVIQVRRRCSPSAASYVFMAPAANLRIVLSREEAWERTRRGAMGAGLPPAPEVA